MGDSVLTHIRHLKWYYFTLALVLLSWLVDPTEIYRIYQFLAPDESVPLVTKGFAEVGNLIYLFLICSVTAVFGRALLETFWLNRRTHFAIKIFGSFWAGYLGAVGLFRIFSVFVAPLSAMLLTSALAAAFTLREYVSWSFKKPSPVAVASGAASGLGIAALVFLLIAITFISQVFWGDFRWVGHGPQQYQWFSALVLKSGQFPTIPIITQHCDEILYTIFMLAPVNFEFEPIMATSLAMAFMKISVAIFIYHFFRKTGGSKFLSASGTAFMLFGAFGLNPTKLFLYFDSGDPLFYVAHATRIVGVPMWLLVLSSILEFNAGRKPSWSKLSLALLGFGLLLTSISNSVFMLCMLVMGFLFSTVASSPKFDPKRGVTLTVAGIVLVFAGACASYYSGFLWPAPKIAPGSMAILTAVGGVVLVAFWLVRPFKWSLPIVGRKELGTGASVLIAVTIVSAIFFGNIFSRNPVNTAWMSFLHEQAGYPSQSIETPFPGLQGGRPEFGGLFMVDAREQGKWVQYSNSPAHFAFMYLTFPILLLFAFMRLRSRNVVLATQEKFLFLLLLGCYYVMFQLFFYIDFVNDMHRSWVKTRFLEGPLYVFLAAFFVFTIWETDSRVRRFVGVVAIIWCVIPFFATERLDQWLANGSTLMRLLGY